MSRIAQTWEVNKSKLAKLVLIVLILICAASLIVNRWMKYAEWHNSTVFSLAAADKTSDLLNEFSFYPGVARVDRDNSLIVVQSEGGQDSQTIRTKLQESQVVFMEYYVTPQINLIPEHLVLTIMTFGISALAAMYYFVWRKASKYQRKPAMELLVRVAGLGTLTLLAHLGISSVVSNFYQLKELTWVLIYTNLVLVTLTCLYLIVTVTSYNGVYDQPKLMRQKLEESWEVIRSGMSRLLIIWVLILIVGLGATAAIELGALFASWLIAYCYGDMLVHGIGHTWVWPIARASKRSKDDSKANVVRTDRQVVVTKKSQNSGRRSKKRR